MFAEWIVPRGVSKGTPPVMGGASPASISGHRSAGVWQYAQWAGPYARYRPRSMTAASVDAVRAGSGMSNVLS